MRARFAVSHGPASPGGGGSTSHGVGSPSGSRRAMSPGAGGGSPYLQGRGGGKLCAVDEAATSRLLRDLMQGKSEEDDLLAAASAALTVPGSGSASGSGGSQKSPGSQRLSLLQGRGRPTFQAAQPATTLSLLELEAERLAFMEAVCSPTTRHDVREWVGKIFTMLNNGKATGALREGKDKRRRRPRRSTIGSDGGLSNQTHMTALTATTATALLTAGGSIASPGYRPRSPMMASDESLVVHHSFGDEPLSVKERLRAFLEGRIPELEAHVNEHVTAAIEKLQHEVDEELADEFLRQSTLRMVYGGESNYLRWQNMRHQVLQMRLNAGMPRWIVEAIRSWDQKKHIEAKKLEYGETSRIYEYLTKRAAHIDVDRLPSEMPVIKTMHASYSLPSMWRDKYITE